MQRRSEPSAWMEYVFPAAILTVAPAIRSTSTPSMISLPIPERTVIVSVCCRCLLSGVFLPATTLIRFVTAWSMTIYDFMNIYHPLLSAGVWKSSIDTVYNVSYNCVIRISVYSTCGCVCVGSHGHIFFYIIKKHVIHNASHTFLLILLAVEIYP